jgi:hypothetical protein
LVIPPSVPIKRYDRRPAGRKNARRRRLSGARRGAFALKGSNWFPRPDVWDANTWRDDLLRLDCMHEAVAERLKRLSARA